MEISDLSPEEKLQFEKFDSQYKELIRIFWTTAVLLLFWPLIIDRIFSISTGMNAVPPLLFNIWQSFGVCNFGIIVALFWGLGMELNKKWLGALLIAIAGATPLLFMIVETQSLNALIGLFLFEITLFVGLFAGIKIKWPKILWVIAVYFGIFLIIHHGFYLPLFSDSGWWGSTLWVTSPLQSNDIVKLIMASIGFIVLIVMSIVSTKKVRRKLALHDVLVHRKKTEGK